MIRMKNEVSGSAKVVDKPVDLTGGIAGVCLLMGLLIAGCWFGWGRWMERESLPIRSTETKLNLNTANAADLQLLPKIGPTSAQRIVAYRQLNQEFSTVDQVLEIERIGPVTLEAIQPYVVVESK